MTEKSIKRFAAVQYGSLTFEEVVIPCAFGGQPGSFTAFIMVEGICSGLGIDAGAEVARIQGEELLTDGLYMVPFTYVDKNGRPAAADFHAITLSRFHTWLGMIPSNIVPDMEKRDKLRVMKAELVDVLYGYFGRPLLPPDMRAEEDAYLSDTARSFYKELEEASQLPGKVNALEQEYEQLRGKVEGLIIRLDEIEGDDKIGVDQQQWLRAMIDILARRYQEKHGQGTYAEVEERLKQEYDFRYYRSVKKNTWPALVRDCIQTHYLLFGRATRLPPVFEKALKDISQDSLF
jgi:hypothetical protein